MKPFDLDLLLTSGLIIFFATSLVALKMTRSVVFSLSAAFLKAGVFLCYFGMLFDGTFTFLDDLVYLEGGQKLYAQDVGITNLAEHWELVLLVGQSDHFVYYLYNTYAFRLLGEGYYAPVALNILLTLLVAWCGTRLTAREFGLSRVSLKWFFGFLLLHPDILAWSNIMNGKDISILLMHVLLLLACSLFFDRRLVAAMALALPVTLILLFMRFYVPVLFAVALAVSLLFTKKPKGHFGLFFLGGVAGVAVFVWLGPDAFLHALAALSQDFVNPFYGFVRFVLTPIPFHTDLAYSFLHVPSLIHWLLFPLACWGAVMVYRLHTLFSRLFLSYLLIFVSLYAVYGQLQGPRHRVQLDYAWAVLQFMGMMAFLRSLFTHRQQTLIHQARLQASITTSATWSR